MIYGIGVDIVNIKRIENTIKKFGVRFGEKILSEIELHDITIQKKEATYLAKRFAAKEAICKAIGTGIGSKIGFKSISIIHNNMGRPLVNFNKSSHEYIRAVGIHNVHISISDEIDNAIAFAVAES